MQIEVLKSKLHCVKVTEANLNYMGSITSGCICLNGAAARKVQVGDIVIIMSYALMDYEEAKNFTPKVVFPDQNTNKIL